MRMESSLIRLEEELLLNLSWALDRSFKAGTKESWECVSHAGELVNAKIHYDTLTVIPKEDK